MIWVSLMIWVLLHPNDLGVANDLVLLHANDLSVANDLGVATCYGFGCC